MTDEHSPVQTSDQAHGAEAAGHDEHGTGDREWTHDPLERSFFGTVGRGYVIGIIVFGLFAFLMIRSQAPEWGTAAALGAAAFVAFFAGVLGGVVLIGLWAMKNEELIRGNPPHNPLRVPEQGTLPDRDDLGTYQILVDTLVDRTVIADTPAEVAPEVPAEAAEAATEATGTT